MAQRLVVIGGDAGGMSAASQARRRRPADDLQIVALDRGRFTSYSACGIPYWIGGVVDDRDRLITRHPDTFRSEFDIAVRLRTEAVEIDLGRGAVRTVALDDGAQTWEPFDDLVIATGARPIRPRLPGIDAAGVFGVQTLEDGSDIMRFILEHDPRSAVVVGSGYIGLEMAEALLTRGLDVAVVEQAEQPMGRLDPDMGALVADAIRGLGIDLRLGDAVEAIETDAAGAVSGVTTDEGTLPADIVILGIGVQPDVDLARAAGVGIGDAGGIVVDQRMRSQTDGVWAAGDCTQKVHLVTRQQVALALGTHANKQGRVAGINLGGGYATFPGVVGTAAAKLCNLEVARTGLSEGEAEQAGFEFVTATVRSKTRAGYFPGATALTLKVVAERRSGRLLGAQIVGAEGAAKRIDVFATALWSQLSVNDLINVDLSYAPPFAPVWDPVLIAARKAWEAVEGADPGG